MPQKYINMIFVFFLRTLLSCREDVLPFKYLCWLLGFAGSWRFQKRAPDGTSQSWAVEQQWQVAFGGQGGQNKAQVKPE